MSVKERGIDFENPHGSIIASEEFSGPIIASEWTAIEAVKGVRIRTWKYENVSEEIVDGALVEVMPGCRTPVQYVETDHTFDENIQQGKFLLFHITPDGLAVYKYDSSNEEISFSLQVHKGELMCLYALKENDNPGEIIECEQPGFSLAKLVTVPEGATKMGDLEIPDEFWKAIKMLDEEVEGELPVEILDMEEEMMDPVEKVKEITDKAIRDVRSLLQDAPDEFIKAISTIFPETPFQDFLDSYEDAQIIAEKIMHGRESIGRKELEEIVIRIIREQANINSVALEGLEESFEDGTLSDDFPSCKDFIDFVGLAIEENGGRVVEDRP